MEDDNLIEKYCETFEKYMPGQLSPYEPLLMSEELAERGIKEVKKLSWLIYDYKRRKHQSYASRGKMVKINAYYYYFHEPMIVETKEIDLDRMPRYVLEAIIKKIDGYAAKHPEKHYLKMLKDRLENYNDNNSTPFFGCNNY